MKLFYLLIICTLIYSITSSHASNPHQDVSGFMGTIEGARSCSRPTFKVLALDGGHGNPFLGSYAFLEAAQNFKEDVKSGKRHQPKGGVDQNILLVSVGTGHPTTEPTAILQGGLMQWLPKFIRSMMNARRAVVIEELHKRANVNPGSIYRFQVGLAANLYMPLRALSSIEIKDLESAVDDELAKQQPQLETLKHLLIK